MKLCYQVATPDVAIADSVTAYQGPLEKSFSDLAKLGYQGVELMTLNPSELDWEFVKCEAEKNGLKVVLVCTGEIFGQLGLSYTNPDPENRKEAIRRSKEIIDFAAYLGANINIGRIRGQYCKELTKAQTEELGGCRVPGTGRLRGTEGCKDRIGNSYHHADEFYQYLRGGRRHGGSGKPAEFSPDAGCVPLKSGREGSV